MTKVKMENVTSVPPLIDSDTCSEGTSVYKYRDFNRNENIMELEEETRNSAVSPPPPISRACEASIRVQRFPAKLYAILAQKEFNEIITWMPHGRSWKILKPDLFETRVMPHFFDFSSYQSFNRLVNAWSFRRMKYGPDKGSYYHELFLRGKSDLQKYMRRLPKTEKKIPMKKQDEPDFRALDSLNPLPVLEESAAIVDSNFSNDHLRNRSEPSMDSITSMGVGQGMGRSSAFKPPDSRFGVIRQQDYGVAQSSIAARMGTIMMNPIGEMGCVQSMGGMGNMGSMQSVNAMASLNGLGGMRSFGGLYGFQSMNPYSTWGSLSGMRDASVNVLDSGLDRSTGDTPLGRS